MDFGFTPSSIVLDAPFVYVNPYTNEVWRPSNYEHNYKGELPLHQALALSRNTSTVRVAQQVGIANVIQRAKALGLEPSFPQELSVSLGAVAVSPLNLTQAYAAFANQGLGVRPRIITSITDAQGRELYRQDEEHWQAVSPQNAYIMATLLKNVVNAGTGSRARIEGRFIAGKTGTTNDEHDAWFVGFTPYLVTGVYVGYDQLQSLGRLEQGGRTGLTALTVAVLFLLATLFSPLIAVVPACATAPALIMVGGCMMMGFKDMDFSDWTEFFPAIIAFFMMPFAYSIAAGIEFGIVSYVALKLLMGRGKEVNWMLYVLAVLFILNRALL